ncbi:tail completion protein gp17 [Tardiphaga alba]|uniref:tail completion protein gp17 n=1 Tax=Tardiphaga alba TaxID=340268 RepID=UPI001BAE1A43|nr:DUF3168 domain-containing protein [Tardiphaga alba]
MKDIRPALRQFLLADIGIAAIVGARVYPLKIPQGINQASIVYTRMGGPGDYHMQGPSHLARPRIQIDAWALTGDASVALAGLIKDRIDGFSGVMGSGGDAVTVQGVFQVDEREDYDNATKLHRVGRDFIFWHDES